MKDIYQSYYTKSKAIVDVMVSDISVTDSSGETVRFLDPCGGSGIFVQAILDRNDNIDAEIDVYEINPEALDDLESKFGGNEKVNILDSDALLDEQLDLISDMGGGYDRIIANPPYGGWQDYERRGLLKKKFNGLYAKETYSLFLKRSIDAAKPGGLISFIIPDTYLNLHRHSGLREIILTTCKINKIRLFPSSFFPGVNFGYSGLSIISLEKTLDRSKCLSNRFIVETDFSSVESLQNDGAGQTFEFTQKEIFGHPDHALYISDVPGVTKLLKNSLQTIGDVADCVTGIYSGNNKRYLRPATHEPRGASKYPLVREQDIYNGPIERSKIINGLDREDHFIPIVKGGKHDYIKETKWYIDWSTEAVQNYRGSSKGRFQNSWAYFRDGIAVPMVTSSHISASLIEKRVFDQSIVGVFPKNKNLTKYLLVLLNSKAANHLVSTINPTANNSANYIKKIPFVLPERDQMKNISTLTDKLIKLKQSEGLTERGRVIKEELDAIIASIYGF